MNKQEFIEKLREHGAWCTECHDINGEKDIYVKAAKVRELLEQLDEPTVPKAVVPQWFADWIEEQKAHFDKGQMVYRLWITYDKVASRDMPCILTNEQLDWLYNNKELATRAILDGYTVEKEQLYYVKFVECDPDSYLTKISQPSAVFTITYIVSDKPKDSKCETQFTEAEIKAIDERYWQFAVKVEETV